MPDEFNNDPMRVPDDDVLLRRIHPIHHLIEDEESGGRRLSSGAFSNTTKPVKMNCMSISQQKLLGNPLEALNGHEDHFLVSFKAGFVRQLSPPQGVTHSPTNDDPAHGDVWGRKTSKTGVLTPLKDEANKNWIKAPPDLIR